MSRDKPKRMLDNEAYNQNIGFLFLVGIVGLLIILSLDRLIGFVSLQPNYAYPTLISIDALPTIWLLLLWHWRVIQPILAIMGIVLVKFVFFTCLNWIIVWGVGFKQILIIPMEDLPYLWVLIIVVAIATWLYTILKKHCVNKFIIFVLAQIFILGALPFLIITASQSFHVESVDSVIVGGHRYIVMRHRSHVDAENPPLVILYQCNKIGMFCDELYRSYIPGYPSHYLLTDNTIKLHGENNVIYEFIPQD
jgi:hypothetical protein